MAVLVFIIEKYIYIYIFKELFLLSIRVKKKKKKDGRNVGKLGIFL